MGELRSPLNKFKIHHNSDVFIKPSVFQLPCQLSPALASGQSRKFWITVLMFVFYPGSSFLPHMRTDYSCFFISSCKVHHGQNHRIWLYNSHSDGGECFILKRNAGQEWYLICGMLLLCQNAGSVLVLSICKKKSWMGSSINILRFTSQRKWGILCPSSQHVLIRAWGVGNQIHHRGCKSSLFHPSQAGAYCRVCWPRHSQFLFSCFLPGYLKCPSLLAIFCLS